jgi:hypothetical protein
MEQQIVSNMFIVIGAVIVWSLFYIDKKYPWDYPIERKALLIFFWIYVIAVKLPPKSLNKLSEKIIDKFDDLPDFNVSIWKKWQNKQG